LSGADLARVKAAAPDDVLRCEECGRIIVRTEESAGTPPGVSTIDSGPDGDIAVRSVNETAHLR
jgi:hypothetical protein